MEYYAGEYGGIQIKGLCNKGLAAVDQLLHSQTDWLSLSPLACSHSLASLLFMDVAKNVLRWYEIQILAEKNIGTFQNWYWEVRTHTQVAAIMASQKQSWIWLYSCSSEKTVLTICSLHTWQDFSLKKFELFNFSGNRIVPSSDSLFFVGC